MSWKYPNIDLTPTGVISSDDLNDGFLPAVNEAQGRLNEHNLVVGAIPATTTGSTTFLSNDFVAENRVALELMDTRGANQTFPGGGTGASKGAWIASDGVAAHNPDGAQYAAGEAAGDGGVNIPQTPVWNVIGAIEPPAHRSTVVPAIPTTPFQVSFFVEEATTLWIMMSIQVNIGRQNSADSLGCMFGLRVNGALIPESFFGSADMSNEPLGGITFDINIPDAEFKLSSPAAAAAGQFFGFPVVCEAVVDVPPGDVVVEGVAKSIDSLSGVNPTNVISSFTQIGNRELIILNMMR